MKTLIFITLAVFVLPVTLPAQIRPVQRKVPVKKEVIRTPNIIPEMLQFKLADSTSVPASFDIKSINQLREQLGTYQSFPSTSVIETITSNQGNAAYTDGKGVVLDALNPYDAATRSFLYANGVYYGRGEAEKLKNNTPFTLTQFVTSCIKPDLFAIFEDISTKPHLYLLTLGTDAPADLINIYIYNSTDGSYFEKDKIVSVPQSSEIRVLFTSNALFANNTFRLFVRVNYNCDNRLVHFNHLQLVQLD